VSVSADPERSLGFLLRDITRLLRRNFDRRVQPLGLTQAQWQALAYLKLEEGMRQAVLADRLEVQPISLARLIDRMEAAGLVERRPDPEDRRAVRLYVTAKARPLLDEMSALGAETLEQALCGLSETEERALIDSLCHIKRNLVEEEAAPAPRRKAAHV
jgi:DNA-binding MarR family transcriptional regulator